MKDSPLLSPKEVALQLGVSPVTVRYWAQEKKLAFITTPGGHRRFKQADVDEFVKQYTNRQPSKISILIIDDDVQHANFLNDYIQQMKLDINTGIANDGFEAGQLIYDLKPELVLLDLMMPGLDGFSVCQRIKGNPATKNTKIVAMTGFPSDENVERILKAGAEQCLTKPINFGVLSNIILKAVNMHIYKMSK